MPSPAGAIQLEQSERARRWWESPVEVFMLLPFSPAGGRHRRPGAPWVSLICGSVVVNGQQLERSLSVAERSRQPAFVPER